MGLLSHGRLLRLQGFILVRHSLNEVEHDFYDTLLRQAEPLGPDLRQRATMSYRFYTMFFHVFFHMAVKADQHHFS